MDADTGTGTTEGDHMVSVKVSETYDLSTQVSKMGIVGIHTPTGPLVERMWPGLVRQYGKFRFAKCDVAMACASMLPADPLQIGVEAGSIAPQDMFNPILYRAVSNATMNNFLSLMKFSGSINANSQNGAQINFGSIVSENDPNFQGGSGAEPTAIDNFDMYYGLLSDTSSWRKAMPQSGLSMRNLVPLVYEVYANNGINQASGVGVSGAPGNGLFDLDIYGNFYQDASSSLDSEVSNELTERSGVAAPVSSQFTKFKGKSRPMPWVNTKFWTQVSDNTQPNANYDGSMITKTEGDNAFANLQSNVGRVPPCYVGLIVLPPAVLNRLFYRIKVTWTIEFKELQSTAEVASWLGLSALGTISYASDYDVQSTAMTTKTGMVDALDADVNKIMEGS